MKAILGFVIGHLILFAIILSLLFLLIVAVWVEIEEFFGAG